MARLCFSSIGILSKTLVISNEHLFQLISKNSQMCFFYGDHLPLSFFLVFLVMEMLWFTILLIVVSCMHCSSITLTASRTPSFVLMFPSSHLSPQPGLSFLKELSISVTFEFFSWSPFLCIFISHMRNVIMYLPSPSDLSHLAWYIAFHLYILGQILAGFIYSLSRLFLLFS